MLVIKQMKGTTELISTFDLGLQATLMKAILESYNAPLPPCQSHNVYWQ
jgi:hypothetical protein